MSKKSLNNYIGRVIDYRKQAPISGAKVSLRSNEISLTSYTDLEGIYKFQISPDKSKNVRAEIYIEASGYRPYRGLINLAADQKDLGDIRLGAPNNQQTRLQGNSNSSSTLVVAVIITVFLILLSLAVRDSPRRTPVYDRSPRGEDIDDLR
jgi:hypothetical protein